MSGPGGGPDPAWLVAQRWYGANDRRLASLALLASEPVAPGLDWHALEARFEDGGRAVYQLFWDRSAGREAAERPEAVGWLFPGLEVASTRLLGGEQSNTSMVVEPGPAVVKVFRRLSAEPNPDVEIVRKLWDHGFRGVPEPLAERRRPLAGFGGLEGLGELGGPGGPGGLEALRRLGGPDPAPVPEVDLAVARRFLAGSRDGWALALEAADFTVEARELGACTAAMHLALAGALGTSPLDEAEAVRMMVAQAERVLGADAPLEPLRRVGERSGGVAIRIHGDYHLGQVLAHRGADGSRWYVLDFEGEPARPVAERTVPSSPLRDVAGMVRSFAYAAAVAGHDGRWEQDCRRAFVEEGYLGTPGIGSLLPPDPEATIDAFELDKAIYEVGYERANRPGWAAIPLAAVERLAHRT